MKVKTRDLIGPALDWVVAKCEDKEVMRCGAGPRAYLAYIPKRSAYKIWRPSTNWVQGGPIIERECIIIEYMDRNYWRARLWNKEIRNYSLYQYSSTPLIAAMRCYVASKLGNIIDIPEELS